MSRVLSALAIVALLAGTAPVVAQSKLETYDAARQALEAVWSDLPLTIRNVTVTHGPAAGYGSYVAATDADYAPGEPINIYGEVLGYGWRPNEDGTFSVLLDVDLALKTASGQVVASQEKFLSADMRARTHNLETFLSLDATLTDFDPGDYLLDYVVHDLAGGKNATFTVPITLTAAP